MTKLCRALFKYNTNLFMPQKSFILVVFENVAWYKLQKLIHQAVDGQLNIDSFYKEKPLTNIA